MEGKEGKVRTAQRIAEQAKARKAMTGKAKQSK